MLCVSVSLGTQETYQSLYSSLGITGHRRAEIYQALLSILMTTALGKEPMLISVALLPSCKL